MKKTWDRKEIIEISKFKIKKLSHRIVINGKEKNFSKVFGTVDYKILIRKLEKYGIKLQYIEWFKIYLTSWKQFVRYSEAITLLEKIKFGVPQDSFLGRLLSLIFVDDLQHVTKFLNAIIFAVHS